MRSAHPHPLRRLILLLVFYAIFLVLGTFIHTPSHIFHWNPK
jgi:uncharacterized protein HemY